MTRDGRRIEQFVEHAVGSVQHPMSDSDLEAKFTHLAESVLPAAKIPKLMALCWRLESIPRASALAAAATA